MRSAFAVQVLFADIIRCFFGKTVSSARAVSGPVLFFGAEIMVLAVWLGIGAFPDTPALLFLLMMIMMTQIYTLPPWNILPLIIGFYLLFLLGFAALQAVGSLFAYGHGLRRSQHCACVLPHAAAV